MADAQTSGIRKSYKFRSASSIAKELDCSPNTVRKWIKEGLMGEYIVLPAARGGNSELRVREAGYQNFLEKRTIKI